MVRRVASHLAKTLLWMAMVLLVLAAVLVGVARQFVSSLHEIQPEVADYLSRQTGLVVAFDDLNASWKGLAPRFQLHNFRIQQNATTPPAILVRDLDLEILLLQSVLHLQPRVRLNLDGALLTINQQDGRMSIAGLEQKAPTDANARINAEDIADLISAQPRVSITDSRVIVNGWYPQPVVLNLQHLRAEAGRITRYLAGDVVLQGPTQLAFQLRAKVRGSFFRQHSLTGDIYLDTAQADWLPWLPEDNRRFKQVELTSLQGGNEIWLQFNKGVLLDATARFIFHEFNLHSDNEIQPPLIKTLSGVARWQREDNGGWKAGFYDFQMVTPRFNWQPDRLSLAATPQQDGGVQYGLTLDNADITPWLNYFLSTQPAEGKLYETLKALRPAGKLQQLALFILHKDTQLLDLRLAARVEQFNSRAWEKYPGFRDLDLTLWAKNDLMIARLDDDYLELNYPYLFRDTLVLKHVDGGLALNRVEDGFLLQSGLLHLNTDDVRTATQFSLLLPTDKSLPPFMQLHSTLRDVDAEKKSLYLPAGVIPPKLLTWLDESILAGRLVRGDIVVHGPLGPDYKYDRRILLGFSVNDADLRFLPDWEEPVRHADADVLVDRGSVWAQVTRGEYFGQTLASGLVEMAQVPAGQQHILSVKVETTGPAESGFAILQKTPLAKLAGEAVKDMALQGDMAVKLDLAVPLDKGDIKTSAAVDVALAQGQFQLLSRKLIVNDLSANVHFDLENGLSATALEGQTLGGPVTGSIKTQPFKQGGQITSLAFAGTAAVASLQDWLRLSLLAPLSGQTHYQAQMELPLGDARQHKHGFINITSDLKGTAVELPAPFGKAAERKSDFRVWLSLDRDPSLISVRYADLFEFSSQSAQGQMQKGVLSLGGKKAVMPTGDYFVVNGRLPRLSTSEWMPVLEQLKSRSQQYSENIESSRLTLLDHSNIEIGELILGTKSVGRQHLGIRRQGAEWALQFSGDFLQGWAAIPGYILEDPAQYAQQTLPANIHIDRLLWPVAEDETATPIEWEPLDFSPLQLPPANIAIERLMLGDGDFGRWIMKVRPQENGVELRDVTVQMRAMDFFGRGEWKDDNGVRSSALWGDVRSDDIANVMRAWGSEPTMGSKVMNGSLNLQWPGAPFEFSLARSVGNLNMKLEDGSFYNVKSGVVGKFWGALNFETLLRRLQLNFKDLQDKDMVYDEITADAKLNRGILAVRDLQLESPALKLQTEGNINLPASELDMVMKVTVPVTRNLVLPAAAIGGVPAAATVWAIEKVLGSQFDKLTTIKYSVKGSFDDPQIAVMDSFNIIPDKVSENVLSNERKGQSSNATPAPEVTP